MSDVASTVFGKLFVHDAADLDTWVRLRLRAFNEVSEKEGEVRAYAGGRRRAVSRVGDLRTFKIDIGRATRADVDQLREWTGTTVLVRDPRGRLVWGVYWAVEIEEWRSADVADVTLQVKEVTYSEAV